MGHVAKSDGRVSEAEIDAARRLMQELRLGPNEIGAAIECFRAGKSPAYDASLRVEQLREACGLRYDLLARIHRAAAARGARRQRHFAAGAARS